MKNPSQNRATPSAPGVADDGIRSRASLVGAQLSRSCTRLLSSLPDAPLGPKLLAERHGLTTGSASRLLHAVAEQNPIDVLQGIPGPAPLRKFLRAAPDFGVSRDLVEDVGRAVDQFDGLIRRFGGDRGALHAVLANWQSKGFEQFVLKRRQAAYKATAELSGASSTLLSTCFAIHPSEEESLLDMLRITAELGIMRTKEDASVYIGTRRTALDGAPVPDHLRPLTLDGHSTLDGVHSAQLEGFSNCGTASIREERIGEQVILTLGPTELGPSKRVDLVTAEVSKPGLRRRGAGYCTDPLSVFFIPGTPCQSMNLDLLIHEDVIPDGWAELLVYKTIPLGPAAPGDPGRAHDLETIPETLQLRHAGFGGLNLPGFPRYIEVLEHSFGMLGWDPGRFSSWRLQIDYPPLGSQFCILLGRRSGSSAGR